MNLLMLCVMQALSEETGDNRITLKAGWSGLCPLCIAWVPGVLGIVKATTGSQKPEASKGFDLEEILISKGRQDPLWFSIPRSY